MDELKQFLNKMSEARKVKEVDVEAGKLDDATKKGKKKPKPSDMHMPKKTEYKVAAKQPHEEYHEDEKHGDSKKHAKKKCKKPMPKNESIFILAGLEQLLLDNSKAEGANIVMDALKAHMGGKLDPQIEDFINFFKANIKQPESK